MTKDGQYIYAIVATKQEKSLGPIGIGDQESEVLTLCYQDIGAVISESPVVKYSVSRANSMAHQKVMEEAMEHYPMLPVRFGAVAEGIDVIKQKLLEGRYKELKELLMYHQDKVELGLKALWPEMKSIFQEIVEENREIGRLKERLMSRKGGPQQDQVRLGEMVKKALDVKKAREEKRILDSLKGLWVEQKANNLFGDQMITNTAFLVRKDQEKAFDDAIDNLNEIYDGRIKLKYVGPVPPCNFVEITVKW